MYQKVKLSKRQIKEDKFTAFMLKSKSMVLDNWQFVVIGVVAAALIVTAVVYYAESRVTRDNEAATKLSRAVLDYRNGNFQVAIMGFSQIIEDFEGEYAARQAMFLLGNANLQIRNYQEAISHYEKYLLSYKKDKLTRAGSHAGIACCYENQGEYLKAAGKYVEAYDEFPNGPLIGDYLISAMRNYLEVDDTAQARIRLDQIRKEFKGTNLTDRATRIFMEKKPG
ncbi:MAG: tetratricopeptide repeat protein [candidate division Zixibacteria bacterium]|nr:tetratricopeptide repeat protein [candidate division Zixibacteria bacterium]